MALVTTILTLSLLAPPASEAPTVRERLDTVLKAYGAGDLVTAETHAQQAVLEAAERYKTKHPLMVEANVLLGSVLRAEGKLAAARPYLEQAIAGGQGKPASEQLATAYFQAGMLERGAGNRPEAVAHLIAARDTYQAAKGPVDGSTIAASEMLAETQSWAGLGRDAVETYRTLLVQQKKVVDAKNPRLGRNLARFGLALVAIGDDRNAVEQLAAALAIYRDVAGPSLTVVLTELADVEYRLRNYHKARLHVTEALDAGVPHFPKTARLFSRLQGLLGLLKIKASDMKGARTSIEKGVEIDRAREGEDGRSLITSLGNLAFWYRKVGDFYGAIPIHENVLRLVQAHSQGTPNHAISLDNLALMLSHAGAYDRARLMYEEAEQLWIALQETGDRAISLSANYSGQGQLLKSIGDTDGALSFAKRALTLFEDGAGPDHPQLGVYLDNYATMLSDKGHYKRALAVFQRALPIHENQGKHTPAVATNLNNCAWVLGQMDRHDDALPLYKRAVEVANHRLGKDHYLSSAATAALGNTMVALGKPKAGLALLRDSVKRTARTLGKSHPWVAERRSQLAASLLQIGDDKGAAREAHAALAIVEANVESLMYGTSERERLRLVSERRPKLDFYVGLKTTSPDQAYDAIVRWKATVLSSLVAQRRQVVGESDDALTQQLSTLASVRAEVATLSVAIPKTGEAPAAATRLNALRRKKEVLERELSRASRRFATDEKRRKMGRVDICKRLKPDEVLLDFVRFSASPSGKRGSEARYVAFVSDPNSKGAKKNCKHVTRVDLGLAAPIEDAIFELRGTFENQDDIDDVVDAARRVRQLVFDPLAQHLENANRIYVVPDAALHSVPFQAFPSHDGAREPRFLVERYTFIYLSTAKDLLTVDTSVSTTQKPLVIGGVTYGGGPDAQPGSAQPTDARRGSGCGLGRQLNFGFLPGSDTEAKAVAGKLGAAVVTLSGAEATEEAVAKALASSTMVHLATHGYFAAGCRSATASGMVGALPGGGAVGVNPLVLSGIALAGANRPRSATTTGRSDGILTAEEVAGLDLSKLQLAILSACETGLGDVRTGEGVLGLRWAFQVAGARSLVMSLWKVPDDETRRLMTVLHEGLGQGKTASDALRTAQLRMLTFLREKGDANPWLWAAFIASGR